MSTEQQLNEQLAQKALEKEIVLNEKLEQSQKDAQQYKKNCKFVTIFCVLIILILVGALFYVFLQKEQIDELQARIDSFENENVAPLVATENEDNDTQDEWTGNNDFTPSDQPSDDNDGDVSDETPSENPEETPEEE